MNTDPQPLAGSPAGLTPKRRCRSRVALLQIVLLVALCAAVWSWRQYARPGRVHYERGVDAAAAGRFREAERQWRLGVAEDPAYPDCYERLGDLYRQVRDYPGAAADYAAAARLRPGDGALFQKLAIVEMAQENEREALPAARRAYELLPDDAGVARTYGDLAQKASHATDALQAFRRAQRLDPGNGRDIRAIASLEMDIGDMWDAEHDLSVCLRAAPNDAWSAYLLAVLYRQKSHTPQNAETARRYAEQSAVSPLAPTQVYLLLGQLYLEAGRVRDALAMCEAVLRRSPNNREALSQLLSCDLRLKRPQEATAVSTRLRALTFRHERIEHLQEVMGFNHKDIPHGLELARLEEETGNVALARRYYAQLVREAPRDMRTHNAFAAFLRRAGRPDMAKLVAKPGFVPE